MVAIGQKADATGGFLGERSLFAMRQGQTLKAGYSITSSAVVSILSRADRLAQAKGAQPV
jgi:hypothetical protein